MTEPESEEKTGAFESPDSEPCARRKELERTLKDSPAWPEERVGDTIHLVLNFQVGTFNVREFEW